MGLLSVLPRSGVPAKPARRRPSPGADFLGWAQWWSSFGEGGRPRRAWEAAAGFWGGAVAFLKQ